MRFDRQVFEQVAGGLFDGAVRLAQEVAEFAHDLAAQGA
jgi:hypothetical protein